MKRVFRFTLLTISLLIGIAAVAGWGIDAGGGRSDYVAYEWHGKTSQSYVWRKIGFESTCAYFEIDWESGSSLTADAALEMETANQNDPGGWFHSGYRHGGWVGWAAFMPDFGQFRIHNISYTKDGIRQIQGHVSAPILLVALIFFAWPIWIATGWYRYLRRVAGNRRPAFAVVRPPERG